jgi:hypothetical protein
VAGELNMSVVGSNWKPHVYTDRELDRIERRGNGTLEDLAAILCRAIGRMDEADKAALRKFWLDYVAEKERTKENDRKFLRDMKIDPDGD